MLNVRTSIVLLLMRIRIGSTNLAEVDGFRFILFCNLGVPAHVLFLPWPAMMIIAVKQCTRKKVICRLPVSLFSGVRVAIGSCRTSATMTRRLALLLTAIVDGWRRENPFPTVTGFCFLESACAKFLQEEE